MRTFLLWLLIGLVPLANLQMVCFDHPGSLPGAVDGGSSAADCADLCPRERQSAPDSGCVLVAGGCSALVAAVMAFDAPAALLETALTSAPVAPADRTAYLAPALAHDSPPPEL